MEQKSENRNTEKPRQRDKRISRNERILRELCDQSKWNNIHIIGVPEEGEREKGIESVFKEVIAGNFPSLRKEIVPQAMELHRSPNTRDPRKIPPTHIIIKLANMNK